MSQLAEETWVQVSGGGGFDAPGDSGVAASNDSDIEFGIADEQRTDLFSSVTLDPSHEQGIFRSSLAVDGSAALGSDQGAGEVDDAIARELFAGEPQDPFADEGPMHGIGSVAVTQPVFGLDLVDLVTEHLSKPLGPAAPMAVAEPEDKIKEVSQSAQLDATLWHLSERIDEPEAAFALHTGVMDAAFG